MGEAKRRRRTGGILPLPPAMADVIVAVDRDDDERLLELLRAGRPDQVPRFAAAARQAGRALEFLKPALMAPTPDGMLAGLYSAFPPGAVLLLAADGGSSTRLAVRVSRLDAIVAAGEAMAALAEAEPPPGLDVARARREGGLLTFAALMCLEHYGRDAGAAAPGEGMGDLLMGAMLARAATRDLLRRISGVGMVPALVCAVAAGRDGAMLLPLAHGRAWPEAALRGAEGTA